MRLVDFVREINNEDTPEDGEEDGHGAVDDEDPSIVIRKGRLGRLTYGILTISNPSSHSFR